MKKFVSHGRFFPQESSKENIIPTNKLFLNGLLTKNKASVAKNTTKLLHKQGF